MAPIIEINLFRDGKSTLKISFGVTKEQKNPFKLKFVDVFKMCMHAP